jgi:hypothetical protein
MNSYNANAIIELRAGGDCDLALKVKLDTSGEYDLEYNEQCEQLANKLDNIKQAFVLTPEQERVQQFGMALIDSFQWKLFKKYLMETNDEWAK